MEPPTLLKRKATPFDTALLALLNIASERNPKISQNTACAVKKLRKKFNRSPWYQKKLLDTAAPVEYSLNYAAFA
jgi:hypothetical protein